MCGAVIHAETQTLVAGTWRGNTIEPSRFYSYGVLRGEPRRTLIDFVGGTPDVKILEPPPETEREPVPGLTIRCSPWSPCSRG